VPIPHLLQDGVRHNDVVDAFILRNEVDLVQGNVGVYHQDLIGTFEQLRDNVVAKVDLADYRAHLVVPCPPQPRVQSPGARGHICGDVRLWTVSILIAFFYTATAHMPQMQRSLALARQIGQYAHHGRSSRAANMLLI
jgi:hypothetical protein